MRRLTLVPLDRMNFPLTLTGELRATFADIVSSPLPRRLSALMRRLNAEFRTRRPAHISETSRYRAVFERPSYVTRWRRTGWLGRRDSNLCISKTDLLNIIPPEQDLGVDRAPETFVRSAARASLIRDAQVRVLPPGLRVLANSDSICRGFGEFRFRNAEVRIPPPQPASPSQTRQILRSLKNRAVPRGFADMSWSPCAELRLHRTAAPIRRPRNITPQAAARSG
jgi:hypothetical protein